MCFQCLSCKALSFLVPRTLPSVSRGKASAAAESGSCAGPAGDASALGPRWPELVTPQRTQWS